MVVYHTLYTAAMRGLPTTRGEAQQASVPWTQWTRDEWIARARSLPRETLHRYRQLSKTSKKTIWIVTAAHFIALFIVILITPTRIGRWFNAFANSLRGMGFMGMVLIGFLVVLSSHPPLIGFSGSMTLIGFTYGVKVGFWVASVSSIIGAAISFLSVRRFFLGWIRKRSNDKWEAFGHVMREKGLPLVCMVRYCPIPWALSNGLFASVEGVKFGDYMIATLALQPRLLIPVFIGSRLTSLTEAAPTHDPLRFWLNLGSITLSLLFSTVTGWWIYKLTLEQMRKLDEQNGGHDGEVAAEALEDGALLDSYSDEEVDEPLTIRGDFDPSQVNPKLSRRTPSPVERV